MWRSQIGSKEVKTITQADDDDWETDPDFVVGHSYFSSIFSVLVAVTGVQEREFKATGMTMNKSQWVCKICDKPDVVCLVKMVSCDSSSTSNLQL